MINGPVALKRLCPAWKRHRNLRERLPCFGVHLAAPLRGVSDQFADNPQALRGRVFKQFQEGTLARRCWREKVIVNAEWSEPPASAAVKIL